jgi:hypothetical protein
MAHEALRELDAGEREAVFGGNAVRIYLDARRRAGAPPWGQRTQ